MFVALKSRRLPQKMHLQTSLARMRLASEAPRRYLSGGKVVVEGVPFKLGERLSLVKGLGSGSYGHVIAAKDWKHGGTQVAIKKLDGLLSDDDFAKSALREASILRHFDHPNIVKIRDVIMNDDEVYVVTDSHHTSMDAAVADLAKSGAQLTSQAIVRALYQILAGVQEIHAAGVVHRDLKPANILVDNSVLSICDFGQACSVEAAAGGATGSAVEISYVASRFYRAPEAILCPPSCGPPLDIWGVGCIGAELLSGGVPLLRGVDYLDQITAIATTLGYTAADFGCMSARAVAHAQIIRLPRPVEVERRLQQHAASTQEAGEGGWVSPPTPVPTTFSQRPAVVQARGALKNWRLQQLPPAHWRGNRGGATPGSTPSSVTVGGSGVKVGSSGSEGSSSSAEPIALRMLRHRLPSCGDPLLLDLIARMLALDPKQRITAAEALRHPVFRPITESAPSSDSQQPHTQPHERVLHHQQPMSSGNEGGGEQSGTEGQMGRTNCTHLKTNGGSPGGGDGNVSDGNVSDGNVSDGNVSDGNVSDGSVSDGSGSSGSDDELLSPDGSSGGKKTSLYRENSSVGPSTRLALTSLSLELSYRQQQQQHPPGGGDSNSHTGN